jgi:cytochrome b
LLEALVMDRGAPPSLSPIRVWDVPTRVFHWLLVASFVTLWLTRDDSRYLDFHVFAGYVLGALVVFRLAWGVVGTKWARFASFVCGPWTAARYLWAVLRREQAHFTGHNPAGAWSIYMLLALAGGGAISGILALAGEKRHGPLAGLVSFAQGDFWRDIHEWLAWAMLVVVGLHLAGVILSSVADRENLARAMVVGRKRAAAGEAAVPRAGWTALAMIALLVAGAYGWFRGYAGSTLERPYLPFRGPELAKDAGWEKECGSCHLAYHPSLLPARSWAAMLSAQADHFGEDLGLSEAVIAELSAYAKAHSAEQAATPAAWKFASRTPAAMAPLRITETPYWKRRHGGLSDADYGSIKKIDCGGCHLDAVAGNFEPGAIWIRATPAAAAEAAQKKG